MKKVLLFFVVLGIIVGIIIGAKAMQVDEQNSLQNFYIEEENLDTKNLTELICALPEVDTLDPLKTQNSYVADILKLIYEPLVSFDEENQIEPYLASSWAEKDEYTWIIQLRNDTYFHNGEKFTSSDVKYTINTLLNEKLISKYYANVSNIVSIDIIDEITLLITLKEKDAYFPSKLTFPILSESYYSDNKILDQEKANKPIGTGPYKYKTSDEKEIELVFNEKWWKDTDARLKKLILKKYSTYTEAIKAFKSSEVDMIFTTIQNWKEKFGFIGINSYTFESSKYEVLIPNTSKSILSESSVRKAIITAINRENIVSQYYDGNAYVKDVPIASNSRFASVNMEYDVEKAKQILINAGWMQSKNGWNKNGKKLAFNIIVVKDDTEKLNIAKQIKQDLNELQIPITITELSWNTFNENIKKGQFDLALATLDIRNEYQIQDLVLSNSQYNYAHYTDENMDGIIKTMQVTDGDAYANNMEIFKQYYKNEMPYIGLFFRANMILTNKSIKGEFKGTDFNPYRNITNFCK